MCDWFYELECHCIAIYVIACAVNISLFRNSFKIVELLENVKNKKK